MDTSASPVLATYTLFPTKTFTWRGSLLQEGRLQQQVRWQALDVHNLRLINLLHSQLPPLPLRDHASGGITPRLWVILRLLLGLLLLVHLLLLLLLAAKLLGRGDDMCS